jgi:hypothetical protein
LLKSPKNANDRWNQLVRRYDGRNMARVKFSRRHSNLSPVVVLDYLSNRIHGMGWFELRKCLRETPDDDVISSSDTGDMGDGDDRDFSDE